MFTLGKWFPLWLAHISGQIIATSHDLTPKGSWGREIPLFQENLGGWNIMIWPDFCSLNGWQQKTAKQNSKRESIWIPGQAPPFIYTLSPTQLLLPVDVHLRTIEFFLGWLTIFGGDQTWCQRMLIATNFGLPKKLCFVWAGNSIRTLVLTW